MFKYYAYTLALGLSLTPAHASWDAIPKAVISGALFKHMDSKSLTRLSGTNRNNRAAVNSYFDFVVNKVFDEDLSDGEVRYLDRFINDSPIVQDKLIDRIREQLKTQEVVLLPRDFNLHKGKPPEIVEWRLLNFLENLMVHPIEFADKQTPNKWQNTSWPEVFYQATFGVSMPEENREEILEHLSAVLPFKIIFLKDKKERALFSSSKELMLRRIELFAAKNPCFSYGNPKSDVSALSKKPHLIVVTHSQLINRPFLDHANTILAENNRHKVVMITNLTGKGKSDFHVSEFPPYIGNLMLVDNRWDVETLTHDYLAGAKHLTSIHLRDFKYLSKISIGFLERCPKLTTVEMRCIRNQITDIGAFFMEKCPALKVDPEQLRDKILKKQPHAADPFSENDPLIIRYKLYV